MIKKSKYNIRTNIKDIYKNNEDIAKSIINVLLIDDSDFVIRILKKAFEPDSDFTIIINVARNLHEARDMIMNSNMDIIIMDIFNFNKHVMAFLKRLKQFYPKPVILICPINNITINQVSEAYENGIVDIIDKKTLNCPEDFPISKKHFLF